MSRCQKLHKYTTGAAHQHAQRSAPSEHMQCGHKKPCVCRLPLCIQSIHLGPKGTAEALVACRRAAPETDPIKPWRLLHNRISC